MSNKTVEPSVPRIARRGIESSARLGQAELRERRDAVDHLLMLFPPPGDTPAAALFPAADARPDQPLPRSTLKRYRHD